MAIFNTVDLFCGAGGFTEGFKKAGEFNTILAIDSDKQAIETFKYNHPHVQTVCTDIAKLNSQKLLSLIEYQTVDIVIGGPPCQGFSIAGLRIPDDPKNFLFKEFVRVVKTLKPKIFIFENVTGLVSMQKGLVLKAIYHEFTNIGYNLSSAVLNAAEYGVPQTRQRFILLGTLFDNYIPMPIPTHGLQKNNSLDIFNCNLHPFITVQDAFSNLPLLNQNEGDEILNSLSAKNLYQISIRGTRQPGKLFNHRATRHSQKIIERYAAIPQGGNIKSLPQALKTKKNNIFKLSDCTPSRTITCNFRTDILHPWIPRGLTAREAARLQSFDDDYRFFGNLTRKAKYLTQDDQIGNAVPPLLALALAKQIKNYL